MAKIVWKRNDKGELLMPKTNRYCFHCKKVTLFIYCDNCGKMFCFNHAAEEGGDWESGYKKYKYHEACL